MCVIPSITTPQDAHKRLLNGSLLHYISVKRKCQTRVDYIPFSTGFKNKLMCTSLNRKPHKLEVSNQIWVMSLLASSLDPSPSLQGGGV